MRTSLIRLLLVCGLLTLFFGPAALGATTLTVPAQYATIQSAINAATSGVDEIVVAPGTYFEKIDFLGKAITLRSSDGPAVTTINGSGTGSVVQCINGEGPGTVLKGFTITGGNANIGGGMLNVGTSPTVNDCIFELNHAADRGGGMYNRSGTPIITATVFRDNSSGAMGGGVFNIEGGSPTITDCRFEGNTSNKGGGMRSYLNSHPTVTDTVFIENHAGEEGGGMDNRKNSNAVVINCKFIGNTAASGGGGMHNYVGIATPTGNPTIVNSLFIGNVAPSGAGMRNNDPSPIITNSTFAYNEGGAAIRSRNGSKPVLTNSIVWANPGGSLSYTLDSVPVVTFSNIEGGFTVNGNIDDDPLFVNPAGPDGDPATLEDNDYRLQSSSLSVDTGIDLLTLPLTDLDGNPRVAGGMVDMGPYEFSERYCQMLWTGRVRRRVVRSVLHP